MSAFRLESLSLPSSLFLFLSWLLLFTSSSELSLPFFLQLMSSDLLSFNFFLSSLSEESLPDFEDRTHFKA